MHFRRPPTAWHRAGRARGSAYLALLFAVVLVGAALGGAAQVWHTAMQRERERQLIWVGHAYRNAIRAYWLAGAPTIGGLSGAGAAISTATGTPSVTGMTGGPSRYPPSLDALLSDPRFQQVRRYLRRRYQDPLSGLDDWVPILAPGGGVMGVRSPSEAEPLKRAGFAPEDIDFTDRPHYNQWAFVYVPPQAGPANARNSQLPTGATSVTNLPGQR